MVFHQQLRSPKVVKRLSELTTLGLNPEQIKEQLAKEFNLNADTRTVRSMIKKVAVRHDRFLKDDEKYARIFKETLFDLIRRAKKNLNILEETRGLLLNKLEEIKQTNSDAKLIMIIREVNMAIRTQNDSIRTFNEILKRLELPTQKTEVSMVDSVHQMLGYLRELQAEGRIKILDPKLEEN